MLGQESDELLKQQLEPIQRKRREQARQELINHGTAYSARALAQEADLQPWERSSIGQEMKQRRKCRSYGHRAGIAAGTLRSAPRGAQCATWEAVTSSDPLRLADSSEHSRSGTVREFEPPNSEKGRSRQMHIGDVMVQALV